MNKIYIDDSLYGDSISLHDIILFGGMKHVLHIKSYPDPKVPPFEVHSDRSYVSKEENSVIIDLTDAEEEYDSNGYFSFDISIICENNFAESKKIHVYRHKDLSYFEGEYRCQDLPGKSVRISSGGTVTLDLDDAIDGVEPFSGRFEFNPYSFKFVPRESFSSQTVDDVEYSLYAYISYDPKEDALMVAATLSAYDGFDNDQSYLIGFGDEDGPFEFDSFRKI